MCRRYFHRSSKKNLSIARILVPSLEWRDDWRSNVYLSSAAYPRRRNFNLPVLLAARFPRSEKEENIGKYYLNQYLSALKCLWKYFESNVNTVNRGQWSKM